MQNVLEAKITADISDLKSKLSQAEKLQQDYAKSIEQTQKELAENISISRGYEKAIAELNKELKNGAISQKEFQKQLQRLKRDEKETEIETAKLRKELSKLKREQKDLASVNGTAGKSFGNLKKGAANANPTLQEFSRVIQDAPFGIQGVGNNITQLVSQFGYLQKSAGGTKQALKAVFSSFVGPAGILFAISTVVSILTVYGDEILEVIKGNNALARSQEAVGKALTDFYGGQVTKLNSYISILQDANTSETQRKNITEELIKIVPGLTKADFNYGNNLDLVRKKIGDYVLAQASRIEADTLVEENAEDLAKKARINVIKNIKDSTERIKAFKKFLEEEGVTTTVTTGLRQYGNQVTEDLDDLEIEKRFDLFADELEKDLKPVQDRINELYGTTFSGVGVDADAKTAFEELKNRQSEIKKQLEESILTTGESSEATKKLRAEYLQLESQIKNVSDAIDSYTKRTKATESYAERQKKLFDELAKEEIEQNEKAIAEFIKQWENVEIDIDPFDGELINIEQGFQEIIKLEDKIKELQALLKSLGGEGVDVDAINLEGLNIEQLNNFENKLKTSAETSKVLTDAMGASFGALSQNIASSLQTGNDVLDSFVGSLINSLGKMLSELATAAVQQIAINQATATSSAIAGGAASGASTGPGAIFSTPAFIATLVGVVGAAFAGISSSFASGGIVPGGNFNGDKVPAFLNSGEVVLNGRQQAQTLMAVANGNMARASMDNEGGIVGEVVLRGDNQVIQLRRAERNMRRYYNN